MRRHVAYDRRVLVTAVLAFVVVIAQIAAGAVLWTWIRRESPTSLIELVGMGIAIGSLLTLLGSQFTITLSIGGIGWILPIVMAAVVLVLSPDRRTWLKSVHWSAASHWISVGVVVGLGSLTLLPGFQRTPLRNGYITGSLYHGDFVFFEAVAQFLSRNGPNDSSLLADFGIRYHWFAYGWIGSLTEVIDADPFVVMTRIFPLLMVLGASLLAVAWASRLSRRPWTPLLAGLLVVIAAFVGAEQGVVLNFDSPSTAYAAVLALAFGLALGCFLRPSIDSAPASWLLLLLIGILAAGTMGAKASQAAVVAVGLLAMGIASPLLPKKMRVRVWLALVVSGTAMFLTYIVVIAGVAPSESNIAFSLVGQKVSTFQGLDPFEGALGGLLGSLVLVLAILPRWLGAVWLPGSRWRPWSGEAAFGAGVALAGILPVLLLSSGTNAGWFAVAASPILGVLSAVGLEHAWEKVSARNSRIIALSALAAIAVNAAVFVAYGLGVASSAPVLWRGPVLAWLMALLLAIPIALWVRSRARFPIRWLAVVTTILVLASVGARFNGAALWSLTQDRLTPGFQSLILWTDPAAQFSNNSVDASSAAEIASQDSGALSESDDDLAGSTTGLVQWSPDLDEAALWLESEVPTGELVAVDATYLQPFLPVVTNLSMYVAGEPYISGYTTRAGAEAATVRQERMRSLLVEPTQDAARALWVDGVRWLWLQKTPKTTFDLLEPWASVAFANERVTIFQLNDPDANSE